MAELRRLLINDDRLKETNPSDLLIKINKNEVHYLRRVLRLKQRDRFEVVDGAGHLWEAYLFGKDVIKLDSSFSSPLKENSRIKPLIGLAVSIPKRGFDDLLRMSCEIGVDVVQPLRSERSVSLVQGIAPPLRWHVIIREAVEQSERFWEPKLLEIVDIKEWLLNLPENAAIAFATTRMLRANEFRFWLDQLGRDLDQIWVVIGPEGGWSHEEELLAFDAGLIPVQLGKSILRTSTAGVAATQLMVSWRSS